MASYKVPQDVEAEDKLLGPFSFRQFIYLLIAAGCGALAFFLGRILLPLGFLFTPLALFFLILSLPLRKDQPMEVYLAAILQFYLKPKKRIWQSDEVDFIVEFTNVVEEKDTISLKTLSSEQTIERISFLSNVIDTGGWAIRGVQQNPFLQESVMDEVNETKDVHEDSKIIESFNRMINDTNNRYRQDIIKNMQIPPQTMSNTNPINTVTNSNISGNSPSSINNVSNYSNFTKPDGQNPTPSTPNSTTNNMPSISQALGLNNSITQQNTVTNEINPAIIGLATNDNLSIESIASEAHRIKERNKNILGGQDQIEIRFR